MPRNGSGIYSLPSGNPVVPATTISSNGWANPTLADLSSAITDSICTDGQTLPTANLPMGNFKHTGASDGTADGDYSTVRQLNAAVADFATTTGASMIGYQRTVISGAISTTLQAWMDAQAINGVADAGMVGDGTTDNTAKIIAAAAAVGEGGTLLLGAGTFRFVGPVNLAPINIAGAGQGATIIVFDNSGGVNDGFVFAAPTKQYVQYGLIGTTVKTSGGNGNYAINCPSASGLNALYPKPTFEHLSFASTDTSSSSDDFAQTYSWKFMFRFGDAWCLTVRAIDALGSYVIGTNPASQTLDGFIRFDPTDGILSARISNITTHNVANFIEIRQKTYFHLTDIDVADAYRGVYDASDRVFESNVYQYGESIWKGVIINAQLNPVKLKNRFDLIASGLIIHRASGGYDHGMDWVGLDLEASKAAAISGIEVSSATGYTGNKIGVRFDGGSSNNIESITLGTLDVGVQGGVTSSLDGATQALQIGKITLLANVTKVFDLQNSRGFRCNGFSYNSGLATYSTFVSYGDTATQSSSYFFNASTDNTIEFDDDLFWFRPNGGTDAKRWRWNATDTTLNLATQADNLGVGVNALLITRSGNTITKIEVRAPTILLNASTALNSTIGAFGNYANDAAAATGGVPVGGFYRNGSVMMIRVS